MNGDEWRGYASAAAIDINAAITLQRVSQPEPASMHPAIARPAANVFAGDTRAVNIATVAHLHDAIENLERAIEALELDE